MEGGGWGGRRKREEYDSWRDAILAVIKAIVAHHARGNEWKMDVNQAWTWEDKAGGTPLFWASHGGQSEAVKLLLAAPGIDVNRANAKWAHASRRGAHRWLL